jgi:hypothetical protein
MGSGGARPVGRHIVACKSAQARFVPSRCMAGRLALGRPSARPETPESRALRASASAGHRPGLSSGAQCAGGGGGAVDSDHRRLAVADAPAKNRTRKRPGRVIRADDVLWSGFGRHRFTHGLIPMRRPGWTLDSTPILLRAPLDCTAWGCFWDCLRVAAPRAPSRQLSGRSRIRPADG